MTIAIKFGDVNDPDSVSGVVYFDAVVKYGKQYGGRVASHPIEAGANITDHYISQNKKYQVQGVISEVDFSPLSTLVAFDGEAPMNAATPPSPVTVGGVNEWRSLIPDVVSQFLGNSYPNAEADRFERTNFYSQVEEAMEEILHGLYYNQERERLENRATLVTMFEMEGNSVIPSKTIENLLITSFRINEEEETGSAMFFEMTLEQVMIVSSEQAEAPSPAPNTREERQTSGVENKGNQEVYKSTESANDTDPTASEMASKGAAAFRGEASK